MVGAVQYGALAACVVLFVPMVMAGWHLSRNKMLFFSGALFITLAVGVHLTPYFPLISNFVNVNSSHKSPPIVVLENRDSCISLLHNVVYDVKKPNLDNTVDGSDRDVVGSWSWARSDAVVSCGFQKLGRADVSELLNGSWVVVAGDSQARLVVVSLLSLVLRPEEMDSVRVDLFKRHSDYQIVVDEIGMKLDFIWAPYTTNLTDLMSEYKGNKNYPDVLVMGGGLWHMLHVTNSSDYGVSLQSLRNSVVSMFGISPDEIGTDGHMTGSVSIHSPHVFWLGMPVLINSMLNTEEKREKMRDAMRDAYDKELYGSRLLRQSGGPLLLLDIQALSQRCGRRCTVDGMHYGGLVYEAAIHVLLNALLIESHQKL